MMMCVFCAVALDFFGIVRDERKMCGKGIRSENQLTQSGSRDGLTQHRQNKMKFFANQK